MVMREQSAYRRWLAVCLLCMAAFFLKSPDAYLNPQFWAEDAVIFFKQQWNHEWPRILVPYAGYYHLLPRLVAWLASFFPIGLAPALYNLTALVVASVSIAYFLWRLSSVPLALVAFLGLFLTPTNGEVFGTLTNSQWFVQFFLLAACFLPASASRLRWAMPVLVLGGALTGPFSAMMLALHAVLLAASRLPQRWRLTSWTHSFVSALDPWRLIALWAGGLTQIGVVLSASGQKPVEFSLHTVLSAIAGMSQTHTFGMRLMPAILFLGLLVLMLLLILRGNLPARLKGLIVVSCGVALLQIAFGSIKPKLMADVLGVGDRYFVLFKVMFWLSAHIALSRFAWFDGGRAPMAIVLCVVLIAAKNRNHLVRAPLPDVYWAEATRSLPADREAVIDIHPRPWTLTLPPKE